jgi:cytoskeletal protein RodZ
MTPFTPKKLNNNNLGEELRRARNLKNLSIEEASQSLGIRKEYLLALESEDFDSLPAGLYGKNFLKKYASFLNANTEIIETFLKETLESQLDDDPFSQKILKKSKFLIFPKIIKNLIIGLAVTICFLYLIFYFKKIILPPTLIISQPSQNLMIKDSSILVVGKTEKEAEIKINNELILNNNNGEFSQLINLKKGVNSLEISAKKKYSQENKIIRQILVE